MMQLITRTKNIYADILQHLQDPTQSNEIVKNEKVYRIRQGMLLKIHEPDQATDYSYWRTVVPNNQEVKIELLREIHCVPYSGHPGFTRTLEVTRRFFYWVHMTQEVRQFVLDCPVMSSRERESLETRWETDALRSPYAQMGPCSYRLCGRTANAGYL